MLQGYPSKSKAVTIVATIFLILLAGHLLYSNPSSVPRWKVQQGEAVVNGEVNPSEVIKEEGSASEDLKVLPCQKLPGAEDVVVVMRTGATEIQDKIPIHFNTTFRCYQDLIIFSDFEETFQGHEVHDVLRAMDPGLTQTNGDFGLYLRLQRDGRKSLFSNELSGSASFEGSKSGKNDNPGWRLDKWKFLPMMSETLKLRPNKKWYVFVESDSYPVWSNILQWLEKLDPTKPVYYGSEVQIGPDVFAHGGSVFVMSKPAIEIGAQYYADHLDDLNAWTAGHWAGDCVLGKALRDAGVPLSWAWPMFQGGHPEKMDFTEQKSNHKKLWCTPALSYHHFSPGEMQRMWDFEQSWIQSRLDKVTSENRRYEDFNDVLEHRNVFTELVWPSIVAGRSGLWENLSPDYVPDTVGLNVDDCRRLCDRTPDCLQYSVAIDGCSISTRQVMLGEEAADVRSGWMLERIEKWMSHLDQCAGFEGWILS